MEFMHIEEKQLIESTPLDNRATLQIYDASRTLIGDRMLVTLFVRLEIPVDSIYCAEFYKDLPSADEIRQDLGDPVAWEHTKQRHFIDKNEKTGVFDNLLADFNSNMRPYLLHPEFPTRYIKKRLKQHFETSHSGTKKLDNETKL